MSSNASEVEFGAPKVEHTALPELSMQRFQDRVSVLLRSSSQRPPLSSHPHGTSRVVHIAPSADQAKEIEQIRAVDKTRSSGQ